MPVDVAATIDRLRARSAWADRVFTINERVGAIGGSALAATIALSGLTSLFPVLLLAIAVAGFVSAGDATFAGDVIRRFGLTGDTAHAVVDAVASAERARGTATIIGVVGLVWASIGVVGALTAAVNAAWQSTGRGLLDRARGVLWLVGAGVVFVAAMLVTALAQALPWFLAPLPVLGGIVLNAALACWTYSTLCAAPVGWRAHLPGAIALAIAGEALKLVGVWLPGRVAGASAVYGALGAAFALLAWFLLMGRFYVYGAVLNVIQHERAHGTVSVSIEAPRMPGYVAVEADRGGAVTDQVSADAPA